MKVTKEGIAKHISDAMSDHEPPMTIAQLSEKTGIGITKLKMIAGDTVDVNGKKRKLNYDELFTVADALDITLYQLLSGNDDANHVVCEELGLSNDTVNKLKKKIYLAHSPYMQKAIDYLVSFPPVLMDIYLYLTNDYHPINSDERTLFPEDIERIDRLAILDDLMQLRGIIKGGTIDETGKR